MISNPRIDRFTRATRDCRGVTVLFDHPGGQLVQIGQDVHRLRCDMADADHLALYQRLEQGWRDIRGSAPLIELAAAPIRAAAKHVTFADLFHSGNIDDLAPPLRHELREFFAGLPASLAGGWPPSLAVVAPLLGEAFAVRFAFERLALFGEALVARLRPADQASQHTLDRLVHRRSELDERLRSFGKPPNPPFQPHVTLAYLPNRDAVSRVEACLPGWQSIFEAATGTCTIEFRSASLFAFTSMEHFMTRRRGPAALVVTTAALAADGALETTGSRKVSVTNLYAGEQPAADAIWRAVSPTGHRPVSFTAGLEIACFNQSAAQDRHFHRQGTEIYTVLQGGPMAIAVADETFTLGPGDSIVVHPGVVHQVMGADAPFLAQATTVNAAGAQDKFVVPDPPEALRQFLGRRVPPLVPNVTMVAFYRQPKAPALADLLEELVQILRRRFGRLFAPYRVDHMHSTWIGLEAIRWHGALQNANFAANYRQAAAIDCDGFTRFVHTLPLPLTIRYGGFATGCACGPTDRRHRSCQRGSEFHSCGRSPYEGSFHASTGGAAVLTGWPVVQTAAGDRFPATAFQLRRAAEAFGVLDKYHYLEPHPRASWENDDCGITLGRLGAVPADDVSAVVEEIRNRLCRPRDPIYASVALEDLAIVKYRDTALAGAEQIIPAATLTGEALASLYTDVGW